MIIPLYNLNFTATGSDGAQSRGWRARLCTPLAQSYESCEVMAPNEMLHVWYIYLHNWVIKLRQMLVNIFQHHGEYGISPSICVPIDGVSLTWFLIGCPNMDWW